VNPPPEQLEFASIAFPRDRRMLCVAEVAERLDISTQHVFDLIDEGHLQALNVGGGERRHWRIPVEAYAAFVAARHSYKV
jgi:excisionase family DNA binding protein